MEAVMEKQEIKPTVGMSVSMGIGSDSYHQIIVKMERNAKVIYTMPASIVLGGVSLDEWNAAPEAIKEERAAEAFRIAEEEVNQTLSGCSEEYRKSQIARCYTYRTTGYNKGRYLMKGSHYCLLTLNNQYHHLDPHF